MWGLSSCNVKVCHVYFVLVAVSCRETKFLHSCSMKFASLIVTVSRALPRRRKRPGEALPRRSRSEPLGGNARLACTRLSVPEIHLVGDLVADNDRFCQSLRVAFVMPIRCCYLRSLIKVSTTWKNMEKLGNSSGILLGLEGFKKNFFLW